MRYSSTSGNSPNSSASSPGLWLLVACAALAIPGDAPLLSAALAPVTRDEMIAFARTMADHQWVAKAKNLKAPCVKDYHSDWTDGQQVIGVAYDWGGMDDIAGFDRKIAAGLAAGSHKDQGESACTAGADCSGFVSLVWKQKKKFGTATIGEIADTLSVDVYTGLKKGDALNRAGVHIVLFDSYNSDGSINVYEASGSAKRVVLSRSQRWSRFRSKTKEYIPIAYRAAID